MWRAITEDDVHSVINDAENKAFRQHLIVTGQTDPLLGIIEQVTLEVRDAIRSCDDNQLHEDSSFLPAAAIYHATAIIRYRLLTRVNNYQISEDRKTEYQTANRYLNDVAGCNRAVAQPSNDESTVASPTKPSIKARSRTYTRDSQDGI